MYKENVVKLIFSLTYALVFAEKSLLFVNLQNYDFDFFS